MDDPADELFDFDPNEFLLTGLPWFLARSDRIEGDVVAPPDALMRLKFEARDRTSGMVAPVFSDRDLAERFLQEFGEPGVGFRPVRPDTVEVAVSWVEQLGKAGRVTHIGFDPSPNCVRRAPIRDFLDTLRGWSA